LPAAALRFLRCIAAIEKLKLHDDEAVGVGIVKRALEEPARQIALNAGHEGAVVIGKIRESRTKLRLQTPTLASTATWSRLGSLTPAKSPASLCRTPRLSLA